LTLPSRHSQPFGRIHRRYRLLNTLLSLGLDACWRRAAVAALELRPGARLMDIGSGPGDILDALPRDISGGIRVALDPEPAMLAGLDRRSGHPILGQAEFMPFRARAADRLVAAFAIRNFADRSLVLKEFFRVLAPGGMGVIIEFSRPKPNLWGRCASTYVRWIIPLVGGIVSGDRAAYRYLTDSIMRFPLPEGMVAELEGAGFVSVSARRLTGGIAVLYQFRRPADEPSSAGSGVR
jgi:demethylmenaquinone methyltransferase/2-methoxy-6-polyprenyl-1,4-benzoquinol methylase